MMLALNHVGLSVVDLDRSVSFYRDLFGMRLVIQTTFGGERYEVVLGLKGTHGRVALLELSGNLRLELFEFAYPEPQRARPHRPVCDHGITHFCIAVTDLDGWYSKLSAAGVEFHCPPLRFSKGSKVTYGRDPDGNVFELLEKAEWSPELLRELTMDEQLTNLKSGRT